MARRSVSLLTPAMIIVILGRPSLWATAIRQALRLVPRRWWTRWPFLPLPDPSYMRFRLVTAYGGDGDSPILTQDLISYLEWCKIWAKG